MNIESNRRNFFKIGTSAAGALFLLNPLAKALGATCDLTPPQTEGPFYPGATQFYPENDLTFIPGHSKRATGQVIYVKGKVIDQNCNPVHDAIVEIWQACASGKYNDSRDPNTAKLDPHFKYWAETYTDKKGEYCFKTIIPGAYPVDENWTRAPHIHFKIIRLGYMELTTQLYFKGQQLNDKDLILLKVKPEERSSVIIDFQPVSSNFESGALIGNFDITIKSVR